VTLAGQVQKRILTSLLTHSFHVPLPTSTADIDHILEHRVGSDDCEYPERQRDSRTEDSASEKVQLNLFPVLLVGFQFGSCNIPQSRGHV